MKKLFFPLLLAASLALGGCATFGFGSKVAEDIQKISDVISGANVSPRAVVIAVNSANGLQDIGTAYLSLPLCRPGGTPICRLKEATRPLKRAALAMRVARNDIEDWMDAHPGTAPPATLYEKVAAAAKLLGDVITKYRAETVVAAIAR